MTHDMTPNHLAYRYVYRGHPKPTFLEVFMVKDLVFRWPTHANTLIFHGFGGPWYISYIIQKIPIFK